MIFFQLLYENKVKSFHEAKLPGPVYIAYAFIELSRGVETIHHCIQLQ